MLKLEQSEVHKWLRLWSFAGAERWQCSLSDCGISVLPSLPWEMSGVIEAAATGPNIHGSEYLLAWQFFFSYFFFSSFFFDCRQDKMQLSLQGPLPTAADGWKPLFGIKTALSFPLCSPLKSFQRKLLQQCQGKKVYIVFHSKRLTSI